MTANNHSLIWKNITMIIFLILIIKFRFNISLKVQNFNSYFELKFLWLKFEKNGKLVLKNVEKDNKTNAKKEVLNLKLKKLANQKEILKLKEKKSNKKLGKKNTKIRNRKFAKKILKILVKNLHFEKLYISEKIGLYGPIITALSVPILATLTSIPIQFLKINYNNFRYEIAPVYNEFEFYLELDAKISFRLIDIISSIINEKLSKLFMRIRL